MEKFTLEFDRVAHSSVQLPCCCPKRDLIAVVFSGTDVCVLRLNYERVCLRKFSHEISSLCWCSDGKILIVGTHDCRVHLLDVENGQIIFELSESAHGAAIRSLEWTDASVPSALQTSDYDDFSEQRIWIPDECKSLIPPLSPQCREKFSALVSTDIAGQIVVSAFGRFPIMKIDGLSFLQGETSIITAWISHDLRTLHVVSPTIIRCLDISFLSEKREEIHALSLQYMRLTDLLPSLRNGFDELKITWTEWVSQYQTVISYYNDHAGEYGGNPPGILTEVQWLLASGFVTPLFQQFLSNALPYNELEKLEKQFATCASSVSHLVVGKLQPLLEVVVGRLSRLRALASWKERFGDLRVSEAGVESAKYAAFEVLSRVMDFFGAVRAEIMLQKEFFILYRCCHEVLNGESGRDSKISGVDLSLFPRLEKRGVEMDALSEFFRIDSAASRSIGGLLTELESALSAWASVFIDNMTAHVSVRWSIPVFDDNSDSGTEKLISCRTVFPKYQSSESMEETVIFGISALHTPIRLLQLKYDVNTECIRAYPTALSKNGKIVSLSPYGDDKALVLYQSEAEGSVVGVVEFSGDGISLDNDQVVGVTSTPNWDVDASSLSVTESVSKPSVLGMSFSEDRKIVCILAKPMHITVYSMEDSGDDMEDTSDEDNES